MRNKDFIIGKIGNMPGRIFSDMMDSMDHLSKEEREKMPLDLINKINQVSNKAYILRDTLIMMVLAKNKKTSKKPEHKKQSVKTKK